VNYVLGFLNVVIVILTIFLIGIILIQRGKGGGLAGAFGGMGGSSAFGTRTGDVFTKVTVGVAVGWILLSMVMVVLTNRLHSSAWSDSPAVTAKDSDTAGGKSRTKSKATDADGGPASSSPAGSMPSPVPDLPVLPELPSTVPGPMPKP
jgi:preprotein translocase subunit SecG